MSLRRLIRCVCTPSTVAVLLLGLSSSPSGFAQEVSASTEAQGVFEAFAANWEAIEDFDLCMRFESFYARGDGTSDQQSVTYRMLGDFSSNQFLFVYEGTRVADMPDEISRKVHSRGAYFYDELKKEAWSRHLPGPARRIAVTSPVETLGKSRFPDPRGVGGFRSPVNFDFQSPLGELYRAEFHDTKDMAVFHAEENLCTVIVDHPYNVGNFRSRRKFTFDMERFVPTRIVYSKGTDQKETMSRIEHIEWVEMGGINLPRRLTGESWPPRKKGVPPSKLPKQYDVFFHWKSVNSDEVFTHSANILGDDRHLLELINESEKELGEQHEDI